MARPVLLTQPDSQVEAIKLPPHSIEAEQAVLGALLLDNTAWDRVADVITGGDFYRDDHRRIFEHIARLIDDAKPADIVTVSESLERSNELDTAGGLAYLGSHCAEHAECGEHPPLRRNRARTRDHAQAGAGRYRDRRQCLQPSGRDARKLLDEAEAKIFQIAEAGARSSMVSSHIQPLLTQVVERSTSCTTAKTRAMSPACRPALSISMK